MYLDRVKISIKAGDGGAGAVSFYRSKLTANGGPDGGDGGKGGDVVFNATTNESTLIGFQYKKKFIAGNGGNGEKNNRRGADGKNVTINVPCGTVIIDAQTNQPIADLTEDKQTFLALRGGMGGRGNAYFATPTRQAPHFSKSGEKAPIFEVVLELKTLADVGLVGYPNVGKSTLLSVISNANPKIANYAFTTLYPNLGVVKYHEHSFVVADIPGLIEGASEGQGLGHRFLKHIERVRLIVHMLDASETEGRDFIEDYKTINAELKKYDERLGQLKQIIVLSKCDLLDEENINKKIEKIKKISKNNEIIAISSIINKNVNNLIEVIWKNLEVLPTPQSIVIEQNDFGKLDKKSLKIEIDKNNTFVVSGGYIEELIRGVVLSDETSNAYFQRKLKDDGVIDKLREQGLKDGDTVRIKDIEFEYYD